MGGYSERLRNLCFRLVIPMILSSTLIYIPKVIFHGGDLKVEDFIINIFGGISYWFTAALAVAQIVILTIAYTIKQKSIWVYVGVTFLLSLIGLYINNNRTGSEPEDFFPWFYMTGLEYSFVMAIGGLYHKYEYHKSLFRYGVIVAIIAYIGIFANSVYTNQKLLMLGLGGLCDVEGLICAIGGVYLIMAICKKLRYSKALSYIGQNSIIYYFMSGVLPASLGSIAARLFSDYNYIVVVGITISSLLLASILTFIIVRYLPFMVDLRKIKK